MRRIQISILSFGAAAAFIALARFGGRNALGLALGAACALLNFRWLKSSMLALTDRIAREAESAPDATVGSASSPPTLSPDVLGTPRQGLLVLRFFLRYAVLGVATYVILSSSFASVYGFLLGLLMVVPALLTEAVYELIYLLRHER